MLQRIDRMVRNVRSMEFRAAFGQDPRYVERHIAVADDHCPRATQRRIKRGEIGMAIIPADKRRRPDYARQIAPRNVERADRAAPPWPAQPHHIA